MNVPSALSVTGVVLTVLLAASPAVAVQPVTGFAAYRVDATLPSGVHSAIVNETTIPSDRAGLSDLILRLVGTGQNLTYSRLVNSSANLFPYLPSLASQSLEYTYGTGYQINLNFSATGTTPISFQGGQYTLNVYSISVLVSHGNRSVDVEGTVEAFPSGLVYDATAGNSTVGVHALLISTDLQLSATPTKTASAAYVGTGLGVGGLAVVAVFMVRRKEKKAKNSESKPLHWVD